MASKEQLNFNDPHPPAENALEAFFAVALIIKGEILKSRNRWDNHEPRMWSRAARLSDGELTSFSLGEDLVLVSSAATTYGTILLERSGSLQSTTIKAKDSSTLGSMTHPTEYHRFHLSPPIALLTLNLYQGTEDVTFHSILTDEGNRDEDGHPTTWQAIQTADIPLVFFNE